MINLVKYLVFLSLSFSLSTGHALEESKLQNTLHPFVTDGCTDSPNGMFGHDWTQCCVAHDVAYWAGGSADEKLKADQSLRACIDQVSGGKKVGEIYFLSVYMFGDQSPTAPYVWGYGWTYYRGQKPLTEDEEKQVEALSPKDLTTLPITQNPKSNILPYPTGHNNYCLDEVSEAVAKLNPQSHAVHIIYSPPVAISSQEEAMWTKTNGSATVTIDGCSGSVDYQLVFHATDLCQTPIYKDQRPNFIASAKNTLNCEAK